MRYDYLVVGSGLFGAVFAHEAATRGKRVLVIDKRKHTGGNVYTETIEGINVHRYGAHIFHTNSKVIWSYINKFGEFNSFINSPIAFYKGEVYSLPFNMYTFNKLWGVVSPKDALAIIEKQKKERSGKSQANLEEKAISLVGTEIYEKLIKGYTQKQWGRECRLLPEFIINRIPIRLSYNNNYFDDLYQGIPIKGYSGIIQNMLNDIEVRLNVDYLKNRDYFNGIANRIIYTGPIDAYFNFCYGKLEYRSLRFETEILDTDNFQGNAVVNYTDIDISWTRIIEHKWFNFGRDINGTYSNRTVITREYSDEWNIDKEPFYPINDDRNSQLYDMYRQKAQFETNVKFGGRLGQYKYYDMDDIIEQALELSKNELSIY